MGDPVTQFLIDSIRVAAEVAAQAQQEYELAVWSLIVSSITAMAVAVLGYFSHHSQKKINGRMDELKEMWEAAAFERGKKEEREEHEQNE